MSFSTPDLCDAHADEVHVVTGIHWQHFGARRRFCGAVETVKCFEDNSRVKEALAEPGQGRVLVVDGGGSLRHALIGDMIAARAAEQGWNGVLIHGVCRDVEVLREIGIGILALGCVPIKSVRRDEGQRGIPVRIADVTVQSGDYIYVDENGVVLSARPLL